MMVAISKYRKFWSGIEYLSGIFLLNVNYLISIFELHSNLNIGGGSKSVNCSSLVE